MHVARIELTNFRLYRHLVLDLGEGPAIVVGDNAQGKTSLLEAMYMVATTRSEFAGSDRELVRWHAGDDDGLAYAQVSALVRAPTQQRTIDIVLQQLAAAARGSGGADRGVATPNATASGPTAGDAADEAAADKNRSTPGLEAPAVVKRIRVDGAPRRALDVVGLLQAVLFAPRDLELVDGPPSARRRYLDVLLCLIDRDYCLALARFNKVLSQRNGLLKSLRERAGGRDELEFWDDAAAASGGRVLAGRRLALVGLAAEARHIHDALVGGGPPLGTRYVDSVANRAAAAGTRTDPAASTRPSALAPFGDEAAREPGWPQASAGVTRGSEAAHAAARSGMHGGVAPGEAAVRAASGELRVALEAARREEIARGVTVVGPHRDDLLFALGDVDVRTFGSRGQQRTVALAVKMAEARLIRTVAGQPPVVLLDDVLSELDAARRELLVEWLATEGQVVLTTTDLEHIPSSLRKRSAVLRVTAGDVRVESGGVAGRARSSA